MLMIVKDAEKTLFQELKSCWTDFPAHRCLQLKFSQLEGDREDWLPVILKTLRNFIDDPSAQLYLCHDDDIFIITRMITHKRTTEFLSHLPNQLAPIPLQGLAALFEIGVDWTRLKTMCAKKIENLQILENLQKTKKKEEVAKVSREETIQTLDNDLISSLAMRRDMRAKAEIMVVEDDPFSQQLIHNALKNKYSVSMTGDGQGAIMNYVNKAPDVLFLDIGLPDINGHEVLEKLFKIDPTAYVVMFSGNGDKENIMKAIELGAKGFVGKPFTQDKLLQYIKKSPFIQAKRKEGGTHGNLVN